MKSPKILIGEDDADDQLLLKTAFLENGGRQQLVFVEDGSRLMDHLNGIGAQEPGNTFPDFIMLDLNMPGKSGKEALEELKKHPVYKAIPVIIYTTTRDEREIKRCYELGANNYIVKPSNFQGLVKIVNTVLKYWYSTATIPTLSAGSAFDDVDVR